jgi:chemotaxis protein methyltransferase CheR
VLRASEAEWKLFGDLIESRLGIVFEESRREILLARLQPRLAALHLETLTEYYHYLSRHPNADAEQPEIARTVTNGETYFFRESQQFEILTRHIVPDLCRRPRNRPLQILSAGCSSGEEPYSVGISLRESGLADSDWNIEGCDINPARLEKARAGVFDESSLRVCDDGRRQRYFRPSSGRFEVRPDYRAGVRFFEANLACEERALVDRYDVIFCRNVLIYFSDTAFQRTIDLLARHLVPGGFLLLGHSESLIDKRDDFQPVCLDGKIVYRLGGAGPSSGSS